MCDVMYMMPNMTSRDQQSFICTPHLCKPSIYVPIRVEPMKEARFPDDRISSDSMESPSAPWLTGILNPVKKAIPPTILDIMANAIRRTLDMVQEKSFVSGWMTSVTKSWVWNMLGFRVQGEVTKPLVGGSSLPRRSQILKSTYLGYVYTKAIRPWLLRILEFLSVESVTSLYFGFT